MDDELENGIEELPEQDERVLQVGQIRLIGDDPCLIFREGATWKNLILTHPVHMGGVTNNALLAYRVIGYLPPAPRVMGVR